MDRRIASGLIGSARDPVHVRPTAAAYERGIALRLIQAGKPMQNAYVESYNGKFRDECLTEH